MCSRGSQASRARVREQLRQEPATTFIPGWLFLPPGLVQVMVQLLQQLKFADDSCFVCGYSAKFLCHHKGARQGTVRRKADQCTTARAPRRLMLNTFGNVISMEASFSSEQDSISFRSHSGSGAS